jgi:hypothetical protein
MIKNADSRRGLLNIKLINRIRNCLRNPKRPQIAAAFMAGMAITAAVTYFGTDAGELPAEKNNNNMVPEQQNMPGNFTPENHPEIIPENNIIYELVYAFTEGALISG